MTTSTKPIVCTLSPTAMAPRLAQIRDLTRRHLRGHLFHGSTLVLTYDVAASDELRQIVSLEQECCAFLDFEIRTQADAIELRIAGPEQEGGDTQWLFSQFLPETQAAAAPVPPLTLQATG
jgi:hypothetical protein